MKKQKQKIAEGYPYDPKAVIMIMEAYVNLKNIKDIDTGYFDCEDCCVCNKKLGKDIYFIHEIMGKIGRMTVEDGSACDSIECCEKRIAELVERGFEIIKDKEFGVIPNAMSTTKKLCSYGKCNNQLIGTKPEELMKRYPTVSLPNADRLGTDVYLYFCSDVCMNEATREMVLAQIKSEQEMAAAK